MTLGKHKGYGQNKIQRALFINIILPSGVDDKNNIAKPVTTYMFVSINR